MADRYKDRRLKSGIERAPIQAADEGRKYEHEVSAAYMDEGVKTSSQQPAGWVTQTVLGAALQETPPEELLSRADD